MSDIQMRAALEREAENTDIHIQRYRHYVE
jgi:hypothetical protein